jgi:hypothetical protein
MSKSIYLVFTNNMMPRLLTNPSSQLLDQYPKDQVVKSPKLKRFKGLALQYLVLENGEIKKASKEELGKIEAILNSGKKQEVKTRRNEEMEQYQKNVEKKMKEILHIVSDHEATLIEYKKELSKAKRSKLWKSVAIISLLGNIVPVYNILEPIVKDLLK